MEEILIGVDPHKMTNVVAAIDEQGEVTGQETFPATRKGMRALERWAKRFPERRWAVEGAGGIGRPLAQKLLAAGEGVVDVPPKLSSRVRVLSTGNSRKNDRLDATFTALAALRNDRLASVQSEDGPEGHTEILRLLTERREDLVSERTRALNRLHVLLRDLLSDPVRKQLSADTAAKLLRHARPQHPAGQLRRQLASELIRDVRALGRRIDELDERIAVEVEVSGTTLTEIFGVGPILAALTPPRELELPFASWTLDRLVSYLREEKGVGMGRTRVAEVLSKEGLRWRKQEGWFGERVDPEFAEKRGPLSGSTHPLQPTA
jgi:transposase